ncbi:MAG TPA: amidohydrolase family protein, partial [Puia sp.]|nr:amidohydrolase family protein [Puia sp.]
MRKLFVLLLMALYVPGSLLAQRTILWCGKLIDPKSGQVLQEMSIVVTGNTITDLQKGYIAAAQGDKAIDLKGRTVMPGLIDAHVHLEDENSASSQLREFTMNVADIAFQSTIFARTTLMAGFTTVRDVGGTGVNLALRN